MTDSLREPAFLILAALAAGPRHGYGIIQEVTALSGGQVTLRPGTLYGALDRLADDGLIELDREEIVDSRLRRYYRITEPGTVVLAAEADRMRRIAGAARQRIAAGRRAARERSAAQPGGPVAGRARGPRPGPAGGVA